MEKRHKAPIDPDNLPPPVNHDSTSRRINAKFHPAVGNTVLGLGLVGAVVASKFIENTITKALSVSGMCTIAIAGFISAWASKETRMVKKLQKNMTPPKQLAESVA